MSAAVDRAEATEIARSLDASLASILTLNELLEAARTDRPLDAARQADLVGLGWSAIAVGEAHGGLALDATARAAIAAVAGRRLLPAALRGESALLAPALAALADAGDAQAAQWLERLLAGELRGGGAVLPAARAGDDALVALAPDARLVALVEGDRATVVELDGAPQTFDALDRGQGYARVPIAAGEHVVTGAPVHALVAAWRLALLGEAYGAGLHVLEQSVVYAGQREQFGRAIAGFQAVAHRLAAMAVELEAADAGIGRLVAADAAGVDADELGELLAHHVPAAIRHVCESAIQVHGGIGFTWELGLHLHYRRVLSLQAELGGAEASAQAVGARYLARRREAARV